MTEQKDAWDAEDQERTEDRAVPETNAEQVPGTVPGTEIVPAEPQTMLDYGVPPFTDPNVRATAEYALVFYKSGFFEDLEGLSQAMVKAFAGRELNIPPIVAMTEIHLIDGKISLSANLLAALVKRSGTYDYRITQNTDEKCVVEFFVTKPERESIGTSSFTLADAERAGLCAIKDGKAFARSKHGKPLPWESYTRQMLRARALSEGVRTHCPDVMAGAAIYVEGEGDDAEPSPQDLEAE